MPGRYPEGPRQPTRPRRRRFSFTRPPQSPAGLHRWPRTTSPSRSINGFGDHEAESIAARTKESDADLLFLGFPSPRKEKWLEGYFTDSGARFAMGVGGSFDVFAGVVPRAPKSMQRVGLEWMWRLRLEPRRMWKRYLGAAPRFALATFAEMFRLWTERVLSLQSRRKSR